LLLAVIDAADQVSEQQGLPSQILPKVKQEKKE